MLCLHSTHVWHAPSNDLKSSAKPGTLRGTYQQKHTSTKGNERQHDA